MKILLNINNKEEVDEVLILIQNKYPEIKEKFIDAEKRIIGKNHNTKLYKSSPIEQLEFTHRVTYALLSHSIYTIGQLTKYKQNDLLKINNLGKKSHREILEVLDSYGIKHRCRD